MFEVGDYVVYNDKIKKEYSHLPRINDVYQVMKITKLSQIILLHCKNMGTTGSKYILAEDVVKVALENRPLEELL